jgi:hypothetical protein
VYEYAYAYGKKQGPHPPGAGPFDERHWAAR